MKIADDVFAVISAPLAQVEAMLREVLSEGEAPAADITLHLLESGGKRFRPAMTLLAAQAVGGDPERVVPVAAAAEMIHMATLVHDDVIDESSMRRGRPTANRLWGNPSSVLTGDVLLARSLMMLVDHGTPEVVRVMSQMIYKMCQGEIVQLLTSADVDQSEEAYFARIEKKTALFFEACCRVGALMSDAPPEQVQAIAGYGLEIGMAFQVIDDVLDVQSESARVGKPVGNDLASGVITLPVIYLLKHPDYRPRVLPHLAKDKITPGDVQAVLELVRQNGAVDYAYRVAAGFAQRAKSQLAQLPPGEVRELLEGIADYVVRRSY